MPMAAGVAGGGDGQRRKLPAGVEGGRHGFLWPARCAGYRQLDVKNRGSSSPDGLKANALAVA